MEIIETVKYVNKKNEYYASNNLQYNQVTLVCFLG